MARRTIPLTDTQIRKSKPKDKGYKLFNGQIMGHLAGELGKKLATFEKLSNMQLKVM